MRGNNIQRHRLSRTIQGQTLSLASFSKPRATLEHCHIQFPVNFTIQPWEKWRGGGEKGKKFILIFSSEKKISTGDLFSLKKDDDTLLCVSSPFFFFLLLLFLATSLSCPLSLCCPTGWDSERVQTQSNSQQRSDFSLRMAPGLGHKSPSIHIFQAGAGFCPAGARHSERAAIRPAPPGVRSQGQLNVWPLRPFSWCGPAMSHPPPCSAPCPHAPMPRASHHNRPHQTAFSSSPKNRDGSGEKKKIATYPCLPQHTMQSNWSARIGISQHVLVFYTEWGIYKLFKRHLRILASIQRQLGNFEGGKIGGWFIKRI